MEDPPGGLAVTSASPGRARLATVTLTAVIVALTAFIVLSTVLAGTFSALHQVAGPLYAILRVTLIYVKHVKS